MKTFIEKAVDVCGGQTALAKIIGKSQNHVWNWVHRDSKVPAESCIPIEKATDGAVHRSDLRPDIYPPDEYKNNEVIQ
jgi:DNA-binding transcriptional regulator YdaS (Cro superfamily)